MFVENCVGRSWTKEEPSAAGFNRYFLKIFEWKHHDVLVT